MQPPYYASPPRGACRILLLLLVAGSACRSSTEPRVTPKTHPAGDVYATLPVSGTPFAAAVAAGGEVYVSQVHGGSLSQTVRCGLVTGGRRRESGH